MSTTDAEALRWWRSLPSLRITMQEFKRLPEYSATSPTGVTPGKRWRRHNGAYDQAFLRAGGKSRWVICEYQEAPDDYIIMTNYLYTNRGEAKRIDQCTDEENAASRRMYTRNQMCKTVTYRPVIRVKIPFWQREAA